MNKTVLTNPKDNVLTCVNENGIKKGNLIEEFNVTTKDDISFGHKILLNDVKKDDPIVRYGNVIAYASKDLISGELINENNTYIRKTSDIRKAKSEFNLRDSGYEIPDISDKTFLGYINSDGSVGTKNIFAINTTVQCTAGIVNRAVEILREKHLSKFPNIDDVVAINHLYGCGVAINAKDSNIPKDIITNISKNPNLIGENYVISLGCEKFLPYEAFPDIDKENILIVQEIEGYEKILNEIIEKSLEKMTLLNERKRVPVSVSKLNLGVQCGGSDAFSGITANPVIGYAVDAFAKAGAKVCFSEVTEVRDGAEILLQRMRDSNIREQFINDLIWYDDYLARGEVDRSENPAPGNKKGGLINVVDKAMGSINKSGFSEIVDVVTYGQSLKKPGLSFLSTSASDFVCGTSQLAAGVTLQLFATGRGTPYNLREYPVIKISSNSKLGKFWFDLIDLDAGKIIEGKETIESLGEKLIDLIIKVASGETKTMADIHEIYNDLSVFNPAPIT